MSQLDYSTKAQDRLYKFPNKETSQTFQKEYIYHKKCLGLIIFTYYQKLKSLSIRLLLGEILNMNETLVSEGERLVVGM